MINALELRVINELWNKAQCVLCQSPPGLHPIPLMLYIEHILDTSTWVIILGELLLWPGETQETFCFLQKTLEHSDQKLRLSKMLTREMGHLVFSSSSLLSSLYNYGAMHSVIFLKNCFNSLLSEGFICMYNVFRSHAAPLLPVSPMPSG